MKKHYIVYLFILTTSLSAHAQQQYSELWGKNGEKWDKTKLPDFTSAGYHESKDPLPVYPQRVNVLDEGAVNDGVADNTTVFRKAIQKCGPKGTLYIPAGKYLLSDSLIIEKSGVCIKGAGPGKTILFFTRGLEELYPKFRTQTPWSWSGAMILFRNNISESGIQDLTVQFPDSVYRGHDFHERAYNGIGFANGAHDGWISNVTFVNNDLAIWIERSAHHITAQKWILAFGPRRASQQISAHHGVNIYGGYNLLQDFEITRRYVHDLSIESASSVFNVFRRGKGFDLAIDHHNHVQKNNLFTNLDAGLGERLYHSGGNSAPLGISTYSTFWGITADRYMQYPDQWNDRRGQSTGNIASGIKTKLPSNLQAPNENWFESIDPSKLYPLDLYEAQMKLRKKLNE